MVLFILATAFILAYNRIGLTFGSAFAPRYSIYSNLFVCLLYLGFLKLNYTKKTVYIGIAISFLVFSSWIYPGFTQLKDRYHILNNCLFYPYINRAYDVLLQSIRYKVFNPPKSIYNKLPINFKLDDPSIFQPGYKGHIENVDFDKDGNLTIHGWAVIDKPNKLPDCLLLKLDDKYYPANSGLVDWSDIVDYFKNSCLLKCGYEIKLHNSCLPNKPFKICILAYDKDKKCFYPSPYFTVKR